MSSDMRFLVRRGVPVDLRGCIWFQVSGAHVKMSKAEAQRREGEASYFQQKVQEALPGASVDQVLADVQVAQNSRRLMTDLISDDPTVQGGAIDFLLRGTPDDPVPPQLTQKMASTLATRLQEIAPDALAPIGRNAVVNTIQSLYNKAIQSGDENLLAAVQNIDLALRGGFPLREALFARDYVEHHDIEPGVLGAETPEARSAG